MHRLRISDEEILIIKKALKMLAHSVGCVRDTAEKELIWRTYDRFIWLADKKEKWYKRPRRQKWYKEIVEDFFTSLDEQPS